MQKVTIGSVSMECPSIIHSLRRWRDFVAKEVSRKLGRTFGGDSGGDDSRIGRMNMEKWWKGDPYDQESYLSWESYHLDKALSDMADLRGLLTPPFMLEDNDYDSETAYATFRDDPPFTEERALMELLVYAWGILMRGPYKGWTLAFSKGERNNDNKLRGISIRLARGKKGVPRDWTVVDEAWTAKRSWS